MRELDELQTSPQLRLLAKAKPLPYTFDVKAYEAIKHASLKRHIDEFGKVLLDENRDT